MNWYTLTNPEALDTPALIVFPERVKENIRLAIEKVGDPARLRPHVKTHKSPHLTRLLLAAAITRFKCATIAEAEMLALEGAPDVLLAYQPIGPKTQRLAALIKKYPATAFSCLIDNPEAAGAMATIFAAAGLTVPVFLDINVGMDRTGIAPGDEAIQLYKTAQQLEGITPVGLHAYDGHIRDTDLAERTRKCDEAFAKVEALLANIAALRTNIAALATPSSTPTTPLSSNATPPAPIIIAGGSPTFPIHAARAANAKNSPQGAPLAKDGAQAPPAPVQCSPGTFVYWDKGYGDAFPDQPFLPAALVVTRVISLRGDTRLCLDLGHKSIAPENELTRRVFFLNGPGLKAIGQSEEHLVVEAGAGHGYQIGDIFYGIPYHVCPTIALYDRAFTVEAGRVTGSWNNIARDRILTI
jgi:D-serine deaminase-like pyridoxal phosphate-dependent protein